MAFQRVVKKKDPKLKSKTNNSNSRLIEQHLD